MQCFSSTIRLLNEANSKMKALDFRVVLEWLANPLCLHGRPPCCGHAFVKEIFGYKK
jgi:hypothetical protein